MNVPLAYPSGGARLCPHPVTRTFIISPRTCAPIAVLITAVFLASAAGAQATGLARGIQHFEARRIAEARSELTAYFKTDPRNAAAAHYIGRTFYADTAWDKAREWFEKAVDLEPRNSSYHNWLGIAYGEQAQRANKFRQVLLAKKVQHEFEKAVQLDGRNIDARDALITFYLRAPGFMGGSETKARAHLDTIRRQNPYRGHLKGAGMALIRKDTAGAEREYLGMLEEYPDSLAPYALLITYYAPGSLTARPEQIRAAKAWPIVDRLLARKPKHALAIWFVGRTAAVTGEQLERGADAIRTYMTTHTPAPGEPTLSNAHFRLGQIMEKEGDRAAAKREYEAALSLDPKSPAARDALKRMG